VFTGGTTPTPAEIAELCGNAAAGLPEEARLEAADQARLQLLEALLENGLRPARAAKLAMRVKAEALELLGPEPKARAPNDVLAVTLYNVDRPEIGGGGKATLRSAVSAPDPARGTGRGASPVADKLGSRNLDVLAGRGGPVDLTGELAREGRPEPGSSVAGLDKQPGLEGLCREHAEDQAIDEGVWRVPSGRRPSTP
jgi:hypothetical protein